MSNTVPIRPRAPRHLTGNARRLWQDLAPQLAVDGRLPPATAASLEIAVLAFATWQEHTAQRRPRGARS